MSSPSEDYQESDQSHTKTLEIRNNRKKPNSASKSQVKPKQAEVKSTQNSKKRLRHNSSKKYDDEDDDDEYNEVTTRRVGSSTRGKRVIADDDDEVS